MMKSEYELAHAKYPPNGWTKLAFRYFSKDTVKKDLYVREILQGWMLLLFIAGLVLTVLEVAPLFIGFVTLNFVAILVLLAIFMSTAVIMNNFRIGKVRRELGLTKSEYEKLRQFYSEDERIFTIDKGFY